MPWQGRRMVLASMTRVPSTPWWPCTASEVVQRYHGDDEHVIKPARLQTVCTWHSRYVRVCCSTAVSQMLLCREGYGEAAHDICNSNSAEELAGGIAGVYNVNIWVDVVRRLQKARTRDVACIFHSMSMHAHLRSLLRCPRSLVPRIRCYLTMS